jgi:hypothetical protein
MVVSGSLEVVCASVRAVHRVVNVVVALSAMVSASLVVC